MTDQSAWLAVAQNQPELPDELPEWLTQLVSFGRSEDIYEAFAGESRRVPEAGLDGTPPRYSAVLVLIGGATEDQATVLLTHRAPSMRTHSGQMAFPGGGRESQDSGPIATALREANEETGLDPESVQPLAIIPPLYIDRTNFAVIPVLAYWNKPHEVGPASPENDWVYPVPISLLADPESRFTVEFGEWNGPAFHVDNMVMWGFTGGLVDAILQRAGWERPWDAARRVDLFNALVRSKNGEALSDMWKTFRGELNKGDSWNQSGQDQ